MALLIDLGGRKITRRSSFSLHHGGFGFLWWRSSRLFESGELQYSRPDGSVVPQSFQCWIFLAFFISFAIKVPMFPFHTAPSGHVEAPTRKRVLASVLLKMGTTVPSIFTAMARMRQCSRRYSRALGRAIVWRLTALAQNDLKKLVAYSSVRTWASPLWDFALNQIGVRRAVLVMIITVYTGALFIVVGIFMRLHSRDLGEAADGKVCRFSTFRVYSRSPLWLPGTNSSSANSWVMTGGLPFRKR